MKKTFFLSLITLFVMSSCVSKKEYTSLENRHKKTQDLLNTATIKLNACLVMNRREFPIPHDLA